MAQTKIEWTHRRHPKTGATHAGYTFNPWIGCTKVPKSPACANCYAEELDKRRFSQTMGGATPQNPIPHWGKGAPRHRTTPEYWKQPLRWNKEAEKAGISLAVFCASLADIFDEEVPDAWREDLLEVIRATPNLDWLLLTKRTAKMRDFLTGSAWWINDTPQNVWLGATMENQECFNARIGDLLATPAKIHFASIEPLCGRMDLTAGLQPVGACPCCRGREHGSRLDWVIVGGESRGPEKTHSRPMHPDDVEDIRRQCWAADRPFFFKQWGDWAPAYEIQDPQAQAMCVANKVPVREFNRGEGGRRLSFCVGKAMAGSTFEGTQRRAMPPVRLLN